MVLARGERKLRAQQSSNRRPMLSKETIYSISSVDADGHATVRMPSVLTERLAITNATLLKRSEPYRTFVVRDDSDRELHRF